MIFKIIIGTIPLVIIVISFILDKKIKKNEKKKNEGIYTDKDENKCMSKLQWWDLPGFHDALVCYAPEDCSWEDVDSCEAEICQIAGINDFHLAYQKLRNDAIRLGMHSEWDEYLINS